MKTFLASLEDTNINFLYFHASAMDKPLVKTIFKKCKVQRKEYYLIPGHSANFVYAYQKSDLQTYVRLEVAPTPNNLRETPAYLNKAFTALIVNASSANAESTYIGNHIYFSFYRQRDNDPLIKVHYTVYSDWDTIEAYRRADECNFKLSAVNFDRFKGTRCLSISGEPNGKTCESEIGPRTDIVKVLTEVVTGLTPKNVNSRYEVGSKGGRYVMKGGRKIYQRGGSGYAFMDRLIPYLVSTFLRPLLHTGYESCSIIYDSVNELNADGNSYFVFLYDFEQGNMRQRFYMDAKILTVAAFEEAGNEEAKVKLEEYVSMIESKLMKIAGNEAITVV